MTLMMTTKTHYKDKNNKDEDKDYIDDDDKDTNKDEDKNENKYEDKNEYEEKMKTTKAMKDEK